MRDVNPRSRERFELSLDGRQVASVVVGAIVVLAVVFVLGLNVGKQVARGDRRAQPGGGDALAALDQAPATPTQAVRDETLTYHDRLVKERPAAPPVERTATVVAPQAPPSALPAAEPPPAAAAAVAPSSPPSAPSAPSAPPAAEPPAAEPSPAPVAAPSGDWCVQVGAANERAEAERIAAKFERFKPRIELAVLQGKTWYRVRLGGYDSKADAEKFLKDLARETGAKGFVTPMR